MRRLSDACFRGCSSLIIPLLLLAITIIAFETTDWDMAIQRRFWSPETGWIIHLDKHSGLGFCYYTLQNIILGILGGSLLIYSVWQAVRRRIVTWRTWYVIVCIVLIPTMVLGIKLSNSMPYPSKITEFGGKFEKRSIPEAFRCRIEHIGKHYKGWPAGHASGSFALMALAFAIRRPRRRWLGALLAIGMGAFAGMGHTMDGNHFFSHNLVTFELAWLAAAVLYIVMLRLHARQIAWKRQRAAESAAAPMASA